MARDDKTAADQPDPAKAAGRQAYRDDEFLNSVDARPLRILAEYMEPASRFAEHNIDDTIVFFGSARIVSRVDAEEMLAKAEAGQGDRKTAEQRIALSRYYEATRDLAHRLTEWSKGLTTTKRRFVVCSGGGPGIMEAANRGASEAKGLNIGLSISLPFEETGNPYISRELAFHFHYFFMRKFWFTYMAKALVVMPGGFGTLDELFETLTLVQTGKVKKALPIVLFGADYWSEVIDFRALARHGTISERDLDLMFLTDSVDEAFDHVVQQLEQHALDLPGARL